MLYLLTAILAVLTGLTVPCDTPARSHDAVISIDSVTCVLPSGQLSAGNTHQVFIRYNCLNLDQGIPRVYFVGGNLFEVYSPDGADWDYVQGSDGPLTLQLAPTVNRWRWHYYYDGVAWAKTANEGADPAPGSGGSSTRAGYYLATADYQGLDGWAGSEDNDIAVILEFTTRLEDAGLTMCVDSSRALGLWEWSLMEYPQWDNGLGVSGPRCWEIVKCCEGRVGDANKQGGDDPTISDVSILIDHLFISGTPLPCLEEADVNQSGGASPTEDDITISDISTLVYHMFIDDPEGAPLPDCM
jgi:hypothetical protein